MPKTTSSQLNAAVTSVLESAIEISGDVTRGRQESNIQGEQGVLLCIAWRYSDLHIYYLNTIESFLVLDSAP